MEYTVDITLRARRPLTEEALFAIAELGGAAAGRPGERHLETTLTVEAGDIRTAAAVAMERTTARVAGHVIAVKVMTTAEADRRLSERPKLVGVTEIAQMLGISKQRVSTLSKREDFPAPIETLASGPVWRAGDLSTFAAGWRRAPGRPRLLLQGRKRLTEARGKPLPSGRGKDTATEREQDRGATAPPHRTTE
jgi:hypothetical protein